jgi:hypothetical protein
MIDKATAGGDRLLERVWRSGYPRTERGQWPSREAAATRPNAETVSLAYRVRLCWVAIQSGLFLLDRRNRPVYPLRRLPEHQPLR